MTACLYVLRCANGSYYVGTTAGSLEKRVAEHQAGTFGGYTALRRPVALIFHQHFERLDDAASAERQVKGWRREKKEALIRGDFAALPSLARRGARASRSSMETCAGEHPSRPRFARHLRMTMFLTVITGFRHGEERSGGAGPRLEPRRIAFATTKLNEHGSSNAGVHIRLVPSTRDR